MVGFGYFAGTGGVVPVVFEGWVLYFVVLLVLALRLGVLGWVGLVWFGRRITGLRGCDFGY